jgi:glycosyltransferase involved in cell wall biosynthesis
VHADYPDGIEGYPYTMAVCNLLESVDDFENVVVSINRTSNPFKIRFYVSGNLYSIVYWSIPFSYLYSISLLLLFCFIKYVLRNEDFDLVHGHKLTTEGYLANKLSQSFNVPLMLSLRGGTDIKNIKKYPYMKNQFKNSISRCSVFFLVSPWAKGVVEDLLGVTIDRCINFPNPCNIKKNQVSLGFDNDVSLRFYTSLSMHQYKRKGIVEVLEAISRLKNLGVRCSLDVYGTGEKKYIDLLSNKINLLGLGSEVILKGFVENAELQKKIKAYGCMIMPSENETFGMAYIEALAAGVPIIYHENTGIDGYIPEGCGEKVASLCVDNLVNAIKVISIDNISYRRNIANLLSEDFFEVFTLEGVSKVYIDKVNEVVDA